MRNTASSQQLSLQNIAKSNRFIVTQFRSSMLESELPRSKTVTYFSAQHNSFRPFRISVLSPPNFHFEAKKKEKERKIILQCESSRHSLVTPFVSSSLREPTLRLNFRTTQKITTDSADEMTFFSSFLFLFFPVIASFIFSSFLFATFFFRSYFGRTLRISKRVSSLPSRHLISLVNFRSEIFLCLTLGAENEFSELASSPALNYQRENANLLIQRYAPFSLLSFFSLSFLPLPLLLSHAHDRNIFPGDNLFP